MKIENITQLKWERDMIHHVWVEGNHKQVEIVRHWADQWLRDNSIVGKISSLSYISAKSPEPLWSHLPHPEGTWRMIIQSQKPLPAMMIKLAAYTPD